MSQEVYKQLLEVMKKRGGAYAGMDIPEFYAMVEEMFTPEEAEVNNIMPGGLFTAEKMAKETGRDKAELEATLEAMANKGLCIAFKKDGTQYYQRARLMPGILEFQFFPGRNTERDKKLARLIHAYKKAFNAAHGSREVTFPAMRVITVDRTIEPENIVHTYDQVQTYIEKYEPIAVGTCYCRHSAVLRGEDIHGMPNEVCMQFGTVAQFSVDRLNARKVTKKEAREILDRAEEAGLIHLSQNMTEDIDFICNCDRWHCTPVTQALSMPKPSLIINSGFEPSFDPDICTACETCIERCPAEALTMGPIDVPEVNLDRCFGCAVCATGCPSEAIVMKNKPGFSEPPKDGKELREAMKAGTAWF